MSRALRTEPYWRMRFHRRPGGDYRAKPSEEFWDAWATNKRLMHELGFRPRKAKDGVWYVTYVPPTLTDLHAMDAHIASRVDTEMQRFLQWRETAGEIRTLN
jgi:hypothetical protein